MQRKKKRPIFSEEERMEIVQAIRFVDKTVFQRDMNKLRLVREYKVDAVFVGSDWQGSPEWQEYEKQFSECGCDVVYLQYTEGISSSYIRERIGD